MNRKWSLVFYSLDKDSSNPLSWIERSNTFTPLQLSENLYLELGDKVDVSPLRRILTEIYPDNHRVQGASMLCHEITEVNGRFISSLLRFGSSCRDDFSGVKPWNELKILIPALEQDFLAYKESFLSKVFELKV